MADRKKVINGLRHCLLRAGFDEQCVGCPYNDNFGTACCRELFRDALDLIDVPNKEGENGNEH